MMKKILFAIMISLLSCSVWAHGGGGWHGGGWHGGGWHGSGWHDGGWHDGHVGYWGGGPGYGYGWGGPGVSIGIGGIGIGGGYLGYCAPGYYNYPECMYYY